MYKTQFLLLLFSFTFCFSQTLQNLPEGPYGGGRGYEGVISDLSGFEVVSDFPSLIAAINNPSITKVYINTTIQIPWGEKIVISKDNFVLAGDRGLNTTGNSQIIKDNQQDHASIETITVLGDHVRITGLEIQGPGQLDGGMVDKALRGILFENTVGGEVDNCNLKDWTREAIVVRGNNTVSSPPVIHHNYFDRIDANWPANDNRRFGYGIAVYNSDSNAQAYFNVFYRNRHSISGTGLPGNNYDFSYNYIIQNLSGHAIDMHGYVDINGNEALDTPPCTNPEDSCNYAGTDYAITNNFIDDPQGERGIVIRGVPEINAQVEGNFYEGPSAELLVQLLRD